MEYAIFLFVRAGSIARVGLHTPSFETFGSTVHHLRLRIHATNQYHIMGLLD